MAGWIEWCGGDCPVRADQLVCVKYRDGMIIKGFAFPKAFVWEHTGCARDIVAYFLAIDGAEAQQRAHSTAAAACKDFCAECAVDGCCEDCCHCSTSQDGAREGKEREVLLFASYCGDDNPECSPRRPCVACLGMSNIFKIKYDDASMVYQRQLAPEWNTTPPAPDEAVEAEREACALEALMVGSRIASHQGRAAARLCAKAIRARSRSAGGAA